PQERAPSHGSHRAEVAPVPSSVATALERRGAPAMLAPSPTRRAMRTAGAEGATMRVNFLVILGVIFLVVGVAVGATHLGDTPYGTSQTAHRPGGRTVYYMRGGGMLIMGGTFVFVGAVLSIVGLMAGRSAAATAQLLATGLAGQATITGLTQTGVYMNRNPQV